MPCRIGLGQLNGFIKDVLDGNATMETLDIMEQTALSIMEEVGGLRRSAMRRLTQYIKD